MYLIIYVACDQIISTKIQLKCDWILLTLLPGPELSQAARVHSCAHSSANERVVKMWEGEGV